MKQSPDFESLRRTGTSAADREPMENESEAAAIEAAEKAGRDHVRRRGTDGEEAIGVGPSEAEGKTDWSDLVSVDLSSTNTRGVRNPDRTNVRRGKGHKKTNTQAEQNENPDIFLDEKSIRERLDVLVRELDEANNVYNEVLLSGRKLRSEGKRVADLKKEQDSLEKKLFDIEATKKPEIQMGPTIGVGEDTDESISEDDEVEESQEKSRSYESFVPLAGTNPNEWWVVLGVSPDATAKEVQKAYHRLCRVYHPDKHQESPQLSEFEEAIKIISVAHDVFLNRNKKNGSSEAPSVAEQEAGNKTKEVSQEDLFAGISQKFESTFSISESDLESIDGYADLTPGQKALVQDRFKQIILGKIEDVSVGERNDEHKKSGFFGRIVGEITKNYRIAELEKANAEELMSGGIDMHRELISKLVSGMQMSQEHAHINKKGKIELSYVSNLEPRDRREASVVADFDKAAAKMSKIPHEWSLETATPAQRFKYEFAHGAFSEARTNLLNLKQAHGADDRTAALWLNEIDARIDMDRIIARHPKAEQEIENKANKAVWAQALKNVVTERGLYFVGGAITRALTGSMLGALGVPIAAAGMGALTARSRAKGVLRENARLARSGVKDTSETAENMVDAEASKQKLDTLIGQIQTEPDGAKREKLRVRLEERIEYTKSKLESGKVSFGDVDTRLGRQIDFVQTLGRSAAFAASLQPGVMDQVAEIYGAKLSIRVKRYTTFTNKQLHDAQKRFLRDKTIMGATIAAGFGAAGHSFVNSASGWFGWKSSGSALAERLPTGHYPYGTSPAEALGSVGATGVMPSGGSVSGGILANGTSPSEALGSVGAKGVMPSVGAEAFSTESVSGGIPAQEIAQEINVDVVPAESVASTPSSPEPMMFKVGARGPEGTLIDSFVANEELAKRFGWNGEGSVKEWAGKKAHTLWLAHATEALKNPVLQEQLAKGGYSQDMGGYLEMMKHIKHADVGLDPNTKTMIFADVEYVSKPSAPTEVIAQAVESPADVAVEESGIIEHGAPSSESIIEPSDVVQVDAGIAERTTPRDMRGAESLSNELLANQEYKKWHAMGARRFLKLPMSNEIPVHALQEYMKYLVQETGLEPRGGFWQRNESVQDFVTRAREVLAQKKQ